MSDHSTIRKSFTLSLVLQSVQNVLKKAYAQPYWVTCELSRISIHQQTGHCYMELVEKNDSGIVAQARGIIWANQFSYINKKFESVTGNPPSNGMQLMLLCSVNFHPVHGFSLLISDIEPSFTLGELARLKKEAIERLKKEKVFDLNKKLELPALVSELAIISVESSRGYQDFVSTILSHPKNYNINWTLYEAILQGENAVATIREAIRKIVSGRKKFDAIAIIRGGAGETGLACYDEYDLAKTITDCPLPVLTGIGHATNETIVEMVAHESFITPTACAQFLLERFETEENDLAALTDELILLCNEMLEEKSSALMDAGESLRYFVFPVLEQRKLRLNADAELLSHHFRLYHQNRFGELISFSNSIRLKALGDFFVAKKQPLVYQLESLKGNIIRLLSNKRQDLQNEQRSAITVGKTVHAHIKELMYLEEKVTLLDPAETLKRGFSITRKNGKAIANAGHLNSGDKIEIEFAEGKINTTI